jgi:hypothetical protein
MKLLFTLAFVLPLVAQTPPAAPEAPAQQAAPAPAVQAPAAPAAAPAEAPPSPVPSAETWITGYIDLGYQWLAGPGGSLDTYRSVVNLGSGPKLVGTDFTILDPKRRLFDRIRVRAYDWGDQPYESLHVFANKQAVYEFNADFRKLAYFNNVPSYANPLLGTAAAIDQQSFDTRRTVGSFTLDLLKGHTFSPFLGYDRDSSAGQGVTVFESNNDAFAVPDTLRDSTNLFRGGVHITRSRFHITLEEGGTSFKNDQNTYTSTNLAPNPGDNSAPIFGQTLGLSSLLQDYGIRGTSTYTKAIVTANPFSWLDFYGTFLYSEPTNNVNYKQYNNGTFILESQLLFYQSEQYLATAAAKMPHTSGNVGWEIRPLQHLRILQSWSTDRLHNAGSAVQTDTLISAASPTQIAAALQASLATNYNQADTTLIGDVSKSFAVRVGYRYVWGDGYDAVLPTEGLLTVNHESISRNIGFGGFTWRGSDRFSVTGELESGQSTGEYFRTSLYNYSKARGLGRYRLTKSLQISATYNVISNHNPTLDASYKFLVHQESAAIAWNPAGKNYSFDGSYEHCVYNSQISYLTPQNLTSSESIYREDCHTISGYFNGSYRGSKLQAGGSAVLTSGSRPTTYYQPVAKLTVPLRKNIGWFAEWRYYGFGETFYMYEAFRAHVFTTGLRFSR